MKDSKEITLGVVGLEVASYEFFKEAGNGIAILMLHQLVLQDIMCVCEALEDETDLVGTARDIVVRFVRVDDLEPI